jgi:ABC-2 type transport system ATP-binding protein/lipopolysaccharide transport system ATP-binding protein
VKKRLLTATGGLITQASGAHGISAVQALDDVTLALDHGERVGLVGHNGAGKSTLLKVLAHIYEPNAGQVKIDGHVAPMFDIGLGMDPESTGYDNIMLRGLFLGLKPKEIRRRMDEIVEFTELGNFLHLPIRTYSTGMRIRLAFAVSTSINPDILLLDEGITMGDAAFREKAQKRLGDFANKAAIIVLASHAQPLIRRLCNKCVLMEHGRVVLYDDTEKVLAVYRGGASQRAS